MASERVYLSSSWKQRDRVRALAMQLRSLGHEVYDFTDPSLRKVPEIPPERYTEQFDPAIHDYETYLKQWPEWGAAVHVNREALDHASVVVLLLPCGLDAHADAFYGLGRGARLIIVGTPDAGVRVPTHLWAERFVKSDGEVRALFEVSK
jgi:hypothetical protein